MRTLLLVCLLALAPASAQTRGTCAPGSASSQLTINEVRATLYNGGNLFFGADGEAGYVVPAASGHSPIYAASLWVGGTVGGELRTAGATYNRFAFGPGPLLSDGSVPTPTDCSAFDRIYRVSDANVAAYNTSGTPTPDLRDWPVQWGAEYYVDANLSNRREPSEPLLVRAPGDPGYGAGGHPIDLAARERPYLIGSQAAFWIMNDAAGPAGAVSTETPIGLEVQVTAYAFGSGSEALRQATIYRFRLIKRSPGTLDVGRAGLWVDSDLGNASDDYIGVDVARQMAFAYNADNLDEGGYGVPPSVGYQWVTGAGGHMYMSGFGALERDPMTPEQMHHRLFGRWNNGQPLTEGGTGTNPSGTVTPWAYVGDPVTGAFWSERNTNGSGTSNPGGDRRHLLSTATFTLTPNVPHDVRLVILFAQGANHLASVTALRTAADNTGQPVGGEDGAPPASALALTAPRPNPTTGAAELTLTMPAAGDARVRVLDVLGRTVGVVHAGPLAAGATVLRLPAGLAPGVYTVVAEAASARATQRLTMTR